MDSHLHLVNLERFRYYWLKPEFSVLQRSYLVEDVLPLYAANDVRQAVLVQAHPSPEETAYLVEVARDHGLIGAVIAHVDLTTERIAQDLDELVRHDIIKGVRHQQAEDQRPDWFLRPDVLRGLRAVSRAGLIYDLLVRPPQLASIPEMLDRVPHLKCVLEHMGKPPVAAGALEPWAEDLASVARHPSALCKISELVTQADWASWRAEDLKPYVQHALRCFGPRRLMWGSGWPVCLLAAEFGRTLSSTIQALGPLSEPDLDRIFRGNARSFYGLP